MAYGVTPNMPVVNPFVKPFGYGAPQAGQTAAPQATMTGVPIPNQIPQASTGGSNVPAMPSNYGMPQSGATVPQIPKASTGSNVPAMPTNYGTPVPQAATQSNSVPVPQMPQRWNVDAPYQERLAHFSDPNNIADAQQELLAIKGIYGDRAGAGNLTGQSGAWAAHNWADQVRAGAGISNDHPVYGNAPNQISDQVPKPATPATPTPSGGYVPSSGAYGQLTPQQIEAAAKARIDKQRAGIVGAVDYSKAGLKNTRDYTQGRLQDARQLENTAFQRTNDPFNGHTDYLAADMLRNRSIADTASGNQYNAAVQAEDAKLASFDSIAPEQQQAMVDDLTKIERQYGLDVGQLTGWVNGERTLPGLTSDRNYDLGLSGLSGQLPASAGGGQTQQAQSQQFNQGIAQAGVTGQYNGQPTYQSVQDAIKNGMSQQQIDNQAKQAAAQMGYNYDNMNANDKQAWAQIGISQQNANTSALNAKSGNTNQNISHLMDVWKNTGTAPKGLESLGVKEGTSTQLKDTDIADLINKSPLVKKQMNDAGQVVGTTVDPADKNALMLYIKSLPGMTAEKALPFFYQFGLYSGN